MPENKIYGYLKEKNLTDLDEASWVAKYSEPENAKKVFSYFKEKQLTDLDETSFTDKYLKKKEPAIGLGYEKPSEALRMGGLPKQEKLSQSPLKTAATTTQLDFTRPQPRLSAEEQQAQGMVTKQVKAEKALEFKEGVKQKLYDNNRYFLLQNKKEAQDLGVDLKTLYNERAPELINNYLEDSEQREGNAILQHLDAKKRGDEKAMSEALNSYYEVKREQRSKYQAELADIQSEYDNVLASINNGELDPKLGDGTLNALNKKKEQLELSQKAFLKPKEALKNFVQENATEISSVAKPTQTPYEQLQEYTNTLYAKVKRLKADLGYEDMGKGATLGGYAQDYAIRAEQDGGELLDELYAEEFKLKNAVKLLYLNRTPIPADETALGVLGKSFGNSLAPNLQKEQGTALTIANNVKKIIEDAKIGEKVYEEQKKFAEESAKPYETYSAKWFAEPVGASLASVLEFVIGSLVSEGVLGVTKLGKLLKIAEKYGKIKGLNTTAKYVNAINKNVAGKVADTIGKTFIKTQANGLKFGATSEVVSKLFPSQEDELNFTTGYFGGVIGKGAESALSGAVKNMFKVFGNKGADAIKRINEFGGTLKLLKDAPKTVIGEIGEEFGESLGQIYKDSDSWKQVGEKIKEQYGTLDKATEFVVLTGIMALGMGSGNSIGSNLFTASKEAYNNLPREQRAIVDAILDDVKKEDNKVQDDVANEVKADLEKTNDTEIKKEIETTTDGEGTIEGAISAGTDVAEEGLGMAIEPSGEGITGEGVQAKKVLEAPVTAEDVNSKISVGGLKGGFTVSQKTQDKSNKDSVQYKESFDPRSADSSNAEEAFAKNIDRKGKSYRVVGVKINRPNEEIGNDESGRQGMAYAMIQDDGNLPSNIDELLTKKAIEEGKNLYPNLNLKDSDFILPITPTAETEATPTAPTEKAPAVEDVYENEQKRIISLGKKLIDAVFKNDTRLRKDGKGSKEVGLILRETLTLKEENELYKSNDEYRKLFDKSEDGTITENEQERLSEIYVSEKTKKQVALLGKLYQKSKKEGINQPFVKAVDELLAQPTAEPTKLPAKVEPVKEAAKPEPEVVVEEEQYEPITVGNTSHDSFTRDNAVDYEEDEKEGDNGRSYTYLSSITVELVDDISGETIGRITKLKDEDGEITWRSEDIDGNEIDDNLSSKSEAQKSIVDKWNKEQEKEFKKEKAKEAKQKAKEAEKAKQKAEKEAEKAAAKAAKEEPEVEGKKEFKELADKNKLNFRTAQNIINKYVRPFTEADYASATQEDIDLATANRDAGKEREGYKEEKAKKATKPETKKTKPEEIGEGLLDILGIAPVEPAAPAKKAGKTKPVNVSNKSELAELEDQAEGDKKTIIEAAKKGIATLKSIFPDMEIYIHEDPGSYNETMSEVGGVANSRGNFAFERDANDNPTGRGRIDINLSNAKDTTVAHELVHAVLLKEFGDNPAVFKAFRDRISKILRTDLNEQVTAFEKLYSGQDVAPEEYLTELAALLSQGGETVEYKPSTLRRVAALINEFVSKITKGKFQPFRSEVDFINFVGFLNQISGAISEGAIIEVTTDKIKEQGNGKGFKSRSQIINKANTVKDIDVKSIRMLSRAGKRVSKGLSVKTVNNQKVVSEAEDLSIDYVKENAPKIYIANANILAGYPIVEGIKKIKNVETIEQAQEVYDIFVRQVANNLKYLIDNFNDEFREISTLWYDGANILAQNFSEKYGVSEEQAAGIIAAMSPQKDWYQNVRLAEMVMMAFKENPIMTNDMIKKQILINTEGLKPSIKKVNEAKKSFELNKTKLNKEKLDSAQKDLEDKTKKGNRIIEYLKGFIGKKMNSVPNEFKCYYTRLWNEVNTTKDYDVLRPDSKVMGVAMNKDGVTKSKVAWGSYTEIGKAVSIHIDGSQENITKTLGEMHKIRNFFNNIIDPMSKDKDVTMDTHAIAAALLMPLSGNTKQVGQNFGTGTSNSSPLGIKGLYYAYAEAYDLAAREKNLLPRQVQSITWEAVRGLFTDVFKSKVENVKKINEIWSKYTKGEINIDEARNEISEYSGGIKDPTWSGPFQEGVRKDVESENIGGRSDGTRPSVVGKSTADSGTIKSKSQKAQNDKIKEFIEGQRKAGQSDKDIRAGLELVADKVGLTKEDINDLMSKEVKKEKSRAFATKAFERAGVPVDDIPSQLRTYTPTTVEEQQKIAEDFIRKHGIDNTISELRLKDSGIDPKNKPVLASVLLNLLYEEQNNTKDVAKIEKIAIDVYNVLDATLTSATEAAQFMAMMREFYNSNPYNYVAQVTRLIEKNINNPIKAKVTTAVVNINNANKAVAGQAASNVVKEVVTSKVTSAKEKFERSKANLKALWKKSFNIGISANQYEAAKNDVQFAKALTIMAKDFVVYQSVQFSEFLKEVASQLGLQESDIDQDHLRKIFEKAKSEKIQQGIKVGLKELELKLKDLIESHYSAAEIEGKLIDKLKAEFGLESSFGLNDAAIKELEAAIKREIKVLTAKEKIKALKAAGIKEQKDVDEILALSEEGLLNDSAILEALGDKLGIKKLTPEESKKLADLAKDIKEAKEDRIKARNIQKFEDYKFILAKKYKIQDFLLSNYLTNIFGSLTSNEKNIAGNVSETILLVGELVGNALASGNPKDIQRALKALVDGNIRGFDFTKEVLTTGVASYKEPGDIRARNMWELIMDRENDLTRTESVLQFLFKIPYLGPTLLAERRFWNRALLSMDSLSGTTNNELGSLLAATREADKQKLRGAKRTKFIQEQMANSAEAQEEARDYAISLGYKPGTGEFNRSVQNYLVSKRPEAIKKAAAEYSARATLTQTPPENTMTGAIANGLNNLIAKNPSIKFFVPVVNTFANLIVKNIERSPFEIFSLAFDAGRAAAGVESAKAGLTKAEVARRMKTAAVWTGIAVLLFALAGGTDDDEEGFEVFGSGTGDPVVDKARRALGWKPNTIRFSKDGGYYNFEFLPFGFVLGMIGNMRDYFKYKKEPAFRLKQAKAKEIFGKNLDALTEDERTALDAELAIPGKYNISEQERKEFSNLSTQFFLTPVNYSFQLLKSLGELVNAVGEGDTAIERFKKSITNIGRGIASPRYLGEVRDIFDNKLYDTKEFRNVLAANVPVVTLGNVLLDGFGREVEKYKSESMLSGIKYALTRGFYNPPTIKPLDQFLWENRIGIAPPENTPSMAYTQDFHRDYIVTRGKILMTNLTEALNNKEFEGLTPQEVLEVVNAYTTNANAEARSIIDEKLDKLK